MRTEGKLVCVRCSRFKMNEEGKTIVITGATSFLAGALIARLSARSDTELVLFRHSYEEAEERLPGHADAWMHFAWAGIGSAGRSDPAVQRYNVEMSMAALSCAASLGCGVFLFAGSQAEYGKARLRNGLQEETAVCLPQSEYGRAKLEFGKRAARWVRSRNEDDETQPMRFIHARLFSVYGPGDHAGSLISTCLRDFTEGKDAAFSACAQDWDYIYIDEAARALEGLLTAQDAEGIYNIASGDIRPLRAYVEELHGILQSRSGMLFGARGDNAEGAVSLRPSLSRIREVCGFQNEVSFAEGIRRTLKKSERIPNGSW